MCCSDGCDMFGRWCAQPEAALTHYAGHGKETIIPVTRPPVTRPPVTCIPTHTINVHMYAQIKCTRETSAGSGRAAHAATLAAHTCS